MRVRDLASLKQAELSSGEFQVEVHPEMLTGLQDKTRQPHPSPMEEDHTTACTEAVLFWLVRVQPLDFG